MLQISFLLFDTLGKPIILLLEHLLFDLNPILEIFFQRHELWINLCIFEYAASLVFKFRLHFLLLYLQFHGHLLCGVGTCASQDLLHLSVGI